MNVNKKYNRSKRQINYKYELILKEILEHKDFSEILYEINGFADDKKWGVTERQNIVCLDENNYRIKIEFTDDATSDIDIEIENKTFNTTKNNVNENNFEKLTSKIKDNKKKNRKKTEKSKNNSSHSKDKKYRRLNKKKTTTNFHRYFNNNNFYDSSNMKSYICSCGKKCICECNSKYCRGDCECDFYDCYKNCYLYNDHFCGCPYDSGEC